MIYVSIIGCFIILLFSWIKLKDVIAPPFILSAIWMLMYIVLLLRKSTVDLSSGYYLSFFLGLCFFVTGFFFVIRNKNKRNCLAKEEKNSDFKFNLLFIKITLLIISILFLLFFAKVSKYILSNYAFNFWQTLSIGRREGMFSEGYIISYSRNAIIAFFIVCGITYFSNPNKQNKKYFFILLIIALFFTVTAGSRGMIFMIVLAVFFSFMIIKNYGNKKTAVVLSVVILIILTTFIVFAFLKYVYEDRSNTFEFILKQMRIYFSTSMIAFVEWIKTFNDYSYGANTFRFFSAIFNAVGYNIEIPNTVQEFVWVYGDRTNVYTILHYYATDFGLIFAFMIQLILGMIHGFLYKKSVLAKEINSFFIALQSISYYPLVYQFFSDQYFTILSIWIQLIFWLWIFTRRGFLTNNKSDPQ
ncbi:O-antigen polymerase [Clostridium cochlearium]|uniref:O-antigen polymerase n=1 Tax=Clostridium cochlearium TaxID=1494 RepID=UPI00156FD692|nr:O-antigen polymerase [Clostridium cochlearium]MBV1817955.1 oligosaccharide repeat unit polymerase [Bacteroidales bacterium MSK.15.36]MCG4571354.1 oligosaccharide repeat unit polymerase [Clostridium cochlearium]MCG4580005.1 oligosaccharide repeat unit polymerase [Clostridium cochlearium]NSJ90595.1 oligosaccharide repeat unit polymerase [Coprococcus sp. MSK.21.13]